MHGISAGSREDFLDMNEFMAVHQVRPVVDMTYPLQSLKEAYAMMDKGGHFGKIVIKIPQAMRSRL